MVHPANEYLDQQPLPARGQKWQKIDFRTIIGVFAGKPNDVMEFIVWQLAKSEQTRCLFGVF